ncbi:chondroitin AC/alginate lyase [Gigaspora margarita]|uniref:Chondroitin AC/alginate lyase n=1 Tax=Gigaspora margarita TaxID=4874 RepID=A0A8H3WWR4_GIGMA|nr:chondroitin AC/alginate lyase [Gigaspora margarita]
MIAQKVLFLVSFATILTIITLCALLPSSYVEIYEYPLDYFEPISLDHKSLIGSKGSSKSTINPDVPLSIVNKEPELTNEDSRMEMVADANGNPKKYLNGHYYTEYLKILREQHNEMLYDLVHKADLAVANTSVYSVTLKPQFAPSNDPHDYLSLARYFWPNPNTKDGMPYIRKDGYSNPEILTVEDYTLLRKLMIEVQHLGFGYFFTKNDTYVKKVIHRLNEWFVDPKTKMNPNLNYGSLIKGSKLGRRTGVLDFHPIYQITQSIPLMRSSEFWDHNIESQFKQWLTEYYDWLKKSEHGRIERNSKNNHGTFYDVQAIHILEYIGQVKEAKDFAQKALKNRVNTGILADGQQPHETDRPTSWFYSTFNLHALFLLAERATHLGFDGWNYRGKNNQSIKTAVDYLLPFALNGGEGWKFINIDGFKMNNYVRILELSWIVWGDDKYLDAIEILRPKSKAEQASDNVEAWEENALCVWSLLNDRTLWPCLL